MCDIPRLGAYIKGTTDYIYPDIATKAGSYVCPECSKDLVLKKGEIRTPHFSHYKSDNPCNYYNHPTEAQIHKDAKMLLKKLLDDGKGLFITRTCKHHTGPDDGESSYEIPPTSQGSDIVLEYRFDYNGPKVADVAYLDNKDIVCLFEIYNTHRTDRTTRPEPWFEIDATELINSVDASADVIHLECVRKEYCDECVRRPCARCGVECPTYILNLTSSKHGLSTCVSCAASVADICNRIFFNCSYADREFIKRLGGCFEGIYKKWYVQNDNKNLARLLNKYSVWTPPPGDQLKGYN